MKTFSKNTKLNACLNGIYNQLLNMSETEEISLQNIEHYKANFENESDFNLAQYGNLLIYFDEVRGFYTSCGYKAEKWSNNKVWGIYCRQVGYIARTQF